MTGWVLGEFVTVVGGIETTLDTADGALITTRPDTTEDDEVVADVWTLLEPVEIAGNEAEDNEVADRVASLEELLVTARAIVRNENHKSFITLRSAKERSRSVEHTNLLLIYTLLVYANMMMSCDWSKAENELAAMLRLYETGCVVVQIYWDLQPSIGYLGWVSTVWCRKSYRPTTIQALGTRMIS